MFFFSQLFAEQAWKTDKLATKEGTGYKYLRSGAGHPKTNKKKKKRMEGGKLTKAASETGNSASIYKYKYFQPKGFCDQKVTQLQPTS